MGAAVAGTISRAPESRRPKPCVAPAEALRRAYTASIPNQTLAIPSDRVLHHATGRDREHADGPSDAALTRVQENTHRPSQTRRTSRCSRIAAAAQHPQLLREAVALCRHGGGGVYTEAARLPSLRPATASPGRSLE